MLTSLLAAAAVASTQITAPGPQGPLEGTYVDAPQVQAFLIDDFRHDPAKLAASLNVRLLVIQGERDIQVSIADAKTLAAAQPKAKLVVIPAMNHVLKDASDDRAANVATYADPSRPVDGELVNAIADFVKR